MVNTKANSKYKTIGEVAKLLNLVNKKNGVPLTYIIRFWEKEFKQIKPKIFSGNRRYYDINSISVLKKIKFLLKDKGMTLKGVKKALNSIDSNIDDFDNTSITQKKLIKSKVKIIKKIVTDLKNNG